MTQEVKRTDLVIFLHDLGKCQLIQEADKLNIDMINYKPKKRFSFVYSSKEKGGSHVNYQ